MKRSDRDLIIAITALTSITTLGTATFMYLEHWTLIESLYFTVATITTVGYGDLHPTSDVSRLAAIVLLLLGVTTVLTSLTVIGTRYVRRQERLLERHIKNITEHMPSFHKRNNDDIPRE